MTERPILFSGAMVRAILDRRKTQTRRAVKASQLIVDLRISGAIATAVHPGGGNSTLRCPYGKPGDLLWVKEAWRAGATLDTYSPKEIESAASEAGWTYGPRGPLYYEADGSETRWGPQDLRDFGGAGRLRPSIYMPRWASRIKLAVTDVRVERVQSISEEDAMAEGIGIFGHAEKYSALGALAGMAAVNPKMSRRGLLAGVLSAFHLSVGDDGTAASCTAHGAFAHLWESINAKRGYGWESNPWVWVVEFRRVERYAGTWGTEDGR